METVVNRLHFQSKILEPTMYDEITDIGMIDDITSSLASGDRLIMNR
jgi:hypothetical protein